MGFIVKNTTKCGVFDLVCPHRCRGCGELGELLCKCCKKDILDAAMNHCLYCGKVIDFCCSECKKNFLGTFVVGYRDEMIGALVEEYKFFGVRGMERILGEVLDEFLPDFNGEIVIVPLPTIRKHVRERGVDHTYQIAKNLAKRRGWKVERLILRKKDTVQVGAGEKLRKKQAEEAYEFFGKVDKEKTYIVFDDIWTTGASVTEVGKILKKNGAKKLVAVVLAINRKGKKPKIIR